MADVGQVMAEVSVPESDASLIRVGQPVSLKLDSYPTRLFHGKLTLPGTHVREEGKERFLVTEVQIENPDGLLKTGMQGKAKILTRTVPLAAAIFRKPVRFIWAKTWPLLP